MWGLSPIFSYQRPSINESDGTKCQNLLWKTLPVGDIDNFDKVSQFFFNKIDDFYDLYITDTAVEKCMNFLERCKLEGFTTFLSIAVCTKSRYFSFNYGTHYFVACKESDVTKLSTYLAQIQNHQPLTITETSNCRIFTNYTTEHADDLGNFLNNFQSNGFHRFRLSLNSALPKLYTNISVESRNINLSIARKAKRLALFLSSRLQNSFVGRPNYKITLIKDTLDVLTTNSENLVNGASPEEIKEAQVQINMQLYIFNYNFRYFLRGSNYANNSLFELEKLLTAVTTAVKCLNYGMVNGCWCVVDQVMAPSNVIKNDNTQQLDDMKPPKVKRFKSFSNKVKPVDNTTRLLDNQERITTDYSIECVKNTVVIMGRSETAICTLLKNICQVLQCGTFETVISADSPSDTLLTNSKMPKEHVVQYGTDSIRFVNMTLNADDYKNADNVVSRLSEYPEIHGIITVIDNNEPELPDTQYNELCFMYKLILRKAFRNCCIVNVFNATATFDLNRASTQLTEFLQGFCERHRLTDVPINSFCIDNDAMQSICQRRSNPNDEIQHDLSRNAWLSISNGFQKFMETVRADSPIVSRDLMLAAKIRSLEDWLNSRRKTFSTPPSDEIRFIMGLVTELLLTGMAIYYRKMVAGTAPLTDAQILESWRHWQNTDREIAALLTHIKQP